MNEQLILILFTIRESMSNAPEEGEEREFIAPDLLCEKGIHPKCKVDAIALYGDSIACEDCPLMYKDEYGYASDIQDVIKNLRGNSNGKS